ncbi:RNA polymerase sigma-B factor [Caldanaerobacter subterraneus subsp. tengcongensis MB4]|uniref:RNA polymerase sigma factor 70 region 4 type 2 domain-containing protein n=2 Tax=Caldanaerobacter subterraneus TaxID=911092 RepID=Q8RCJ9_CALS4|nr:sigma-70 family RNA polymerase sigma factor [Caldanaerobacter subterraneus]AAM23712.1 hypothetical protein TTE0428 [Caldanaerobacter subterraneus subsp. tengcongensis MB4]ERM93320.1 hypothetical protein O163_01435 [Caldanaerobacter subterraneus subsp. yonseiensis KB-1]MCS3916793.1 RNA polymerase sigma-B factor [Caldanaerobacter subterraneus subsp. tengcongensis MB4]
MLNINDKKLISYIAKGMKNEYIRLYKKYKKIKEKEIPVEDEEIISSDDENTQNIETKLAIEEALQKLTPLQKEIIIETILYGEKEKEVALKLHISQQAVNKTKKRALKKMREFLGEDFLDGL